MINEAMGSWWSSYLSALDSAPVPTKTVTSLIITGSGNLLSQIIEGRTAIDWAAVKMYCTWGFILAPLNHVWQNTIATRGPGSSTPLRFLATIAVDHVLWKVPIVFCFIAYTKLWAGASPAEALRSATALSRLDGDIQKASVKAWPLIQVVNFWLVPLKLRVLYMNSSLLLWIVYLAIKLRSSDPRTGKGETGRKKQ